MLGFLTALLFSYTIVQYFVRKGLLRLGDRIQKLERILGIEEYRTTMSLERVIWCSGLTILFATIFTAYLTVRSLP